MGAPAAVPGDRPVLHHLEQVMGTVVTIDAWAPPGAGAPPDARERLERTREILHEADDVFSTWRLDTPLSRLRRGEITLDQAKPEVAAVLDACARAREISGGWFDPWRMPGGVDPTGYVKGWATQRAAAALAGEGLCGVMVNAAGDIASIGRMPSGAAFRVGIADPFARDRLWGVVELAEAIATSGTYERGEHLLDPHTGRPAAAAASASVTGPDLGLADALATALAVAGEPVLALLEDLTGYEGLMLRWNRGHAATSAFPFARVAG